MPDIVPRFHLFTLKPSSSWLVQDPISDSGKIVVFQNDDKDKTHE